MQFALEHIGASDHLRMRRDAGSHTDNKGMVATKPRTFVFGKTAYANPLLGTGEVLRGPRCRCAHESAILGAAEPRNADDVRALRDVVPRSDLLHLSRQRADEELAETGRNKEART